MQIISSQHYLDEEIVEAKIAEGNFEVMISPVFEHGGKQIAVVLDGHHRLEAAKRAGVTPTFWEADKRDDDRIALLESTEEYDANPEAFLEATWMDGDYYDIETGGSVW